MLRTVIVIIFILTLACCKNSGQKKQTDNTLQIEQITHYK